MTLQQRLTQAPAREFEFRNYLVAEAYFYRERPIEKTRPKASILSQEGRDKASGDVGETRPYRIRYPPNKILHTKTAAITPIRSANSPAGIA